MATNQAICRRLFFQLFATQLTTVCTVLAGNVVRFLYHLSTTTISTIDPFIYRDAPSMSSDNGLFKHGSPLQQPAISIIPKIPNFYPLRFYQLLSQMADNLRRAVQDINLGFDDIPFALPEDVVNQAVAENRFILFGRPVIPRRQNLRSIVASMPRIWGQSGLVHGRITEGRQFQFIFPTEESLETVVRRGPWAFNDRMLLLQRWEPQMPLLPFISFWVQIRGIPFQFLNRGIVEHIGRALGQVLDVDFDVEAVARVDFARVLLHWDITHPLRFQRHFQFTAGVNTLLRFRWERLRGFCEVCGMLTHDSGACLIQNGGEEQLDDDDDEEEHPSGHHHNRGVVIREIDDDDPMAPNNGENQNDANQQGDIPMQNDGARTTVTEVLSDIDPNHDALTGLGSSDGSSGGRRDGDLFDTPTSAFHRRFPLSGEPAIYPLALMDSEGVINPDTSPTIDCGKRKREDSPDSDDSDGLYKVPAREMGEGSGSRPSEPDLMRGAVGPQPPLPP